MMLVTAHSFTAALIGLSEHVRMCCRGVPMTPAVSNPSFDQALHPEAEITSSDDIALTAS